MVSAWRGSWILLRAVVLCLRSSRYMHAYVSDPFMSLSLTTRLTAPAMARGPMYHMFQELVPVNFKKPRAYDPSHGGQARVGDSEQCQPDHYSDWLSLLATTSESTTLGRDLAQ